MWMCDKSETDKCVPGLLEMRCYVSHFAEMDSFLQREGLNFLITEGHCNTGILNKAAFLGS